MKELIGFSCWLLASLALSFPVSSEPLKASVAKDGLRATITAGQEPGSPVLVDWRFSKPLPGPLRSVEIKLNGRVLPSISIQKITDAGVVLAGLTMTDVTGPTPDDNTRRKAASLLINGSTGPNRLVLNTAIADRLLIAEPGVGDTGYGLASMVGFGHAQASPDVGQSLQQSVSVFGNITELLGKQPLQRRAIFLVTDGHSQPPLDVEAIKASLLPLDIAVDVLFQETGRNADVAAFKALAEATGGTFVSGESVVRFAADPFRFHGSGGIISIPTDRLIRYPWEAASELGATFFYGDVPLSLALPLMLPTASWQQSGYYLWERYKVEWLVAVGALVGALAALMLARFARPNRQPAAADMAASNAGDVVFEAPIVQPEIPAASPLPAQDIALLPAEWMLHDLDTGQTYPLTGERTVIGRSTSADVLLNDLAVSRLHAEIMLLPEGKIELRQVSESNETRVNHLVVTQSMLREGDLITLGNTTLYFGQVKRAA